MPLSDRQQQQLSHARERVSRHLRDEFHTLRDRAVAVYTNGLSENRSDDADEGRRSAAELTAVLRELLERADYEPLPRSSVDPIVNKDSLSRVKVSVDFSDFSEVCVFTRHPTRRSEVLSSFFGLRQQTIDYINFERVVFFARLSADSAVRQLPVATAGDWVLKLFRDVPAADLEMIFPNVEIRMRTLDKLLMAIPALISGVMVVTTKLGSALLLMGSIIGFWLGLHSEPVALNRATALILLAGMGALAMYLWRQAGKFKKRRLRYSKSLSENLYFHLLDDNAGVFFRVLFEAEQAELKECLLSYHLLLHSVDGYSSDALDRAVSAWLDTQGDTRTDFCSQRAMQVLQSLDLVACEQGRWRVREELTI